MTTTYLLTSGNLLWEILKKYGHDPEPVFFEEGVRKEMLFEERSRSNSPQSLNSGINSRIFKL